MYNCVSLKQAGSSPGKNKLRSKESNEFSYNLNAYEVTKQNQLWVCQVRKTESRNGRKNIFLNEYFFCNIIHLLSPFFWSPF